MKNSKDKFKKQKEQVLRAYELLENSPICFDDNINKQILSQRRETFNNSEFVIAIAGQIKAGKSTMLNALLFDKEILPSDDTPHTAKVTEIRYGKTPSILAKFYTKDEIDSLGIKIDDELVPLLGQEKTDEIDMLKEYAANKGKYTDITSKVLLYYPSPKLKNLVIVDTPGINDTNHLRSKMTLEWIGKCDAAIYASYAGQALSLEDFKFIDEYLIRLDAKKRIIALNKCDTINSDDPYQEAKNIVQSMKSDKNLNARIFNDESLFVYTSSLIEFINKKLKNNTPLSEDEEWFLQNTNLRDSGMADLEEAVFTKLLQNKGRDLLKGAKDYMLGSLEIHIAKVNKQMGLISNQIEQNSIDSDEIAAKREQNKKEYKELRELLEKHDEKFKQANKNIAEYFSNKIEADEQEQLNFIIQSTWERQSSSSVKYFGRWSVKTAVEKLQDAIVLHTRHSLDSFESVLEGALIEIKENLIKYKSFNQEYLQSSINFAAINMQKEYKQDVSSKLSNFGDDAYAEHETGFFRTIFNWFDDGAYAQSLKEAINQKSKRLLANICHDANIKLKRILTENSERLSSALMQCADECFRENAEILNQIENKGKANQEEMKSLVSELAKLNTKKRELSELLKNLDEILEKI